MKPDFAGRARALVGTRFRLQGRNAAGLDCVGMILQTFDLPESSARHNYRLRGQHRDEVEEGLRRHFRPIRQSQRRPGDVLLLSVADDQLHLGVCTDAGFVHAHARIGRVVETPGDPEWPVLAVYRRRVR
jgi:hypothetical protein